MDICRPLKLLLQLDARLSKIREAQIPGLRHDSPSCMALYVGACERARKLT